MDAIVVGSEGGSDDGGDDVLFVDETPPDPNYKHEDEVVFVRRERSKRKVAGGEDMSEDVQVCHVYIPSSADDTLTESASSSRQLRVGKQSTGDSRESEDVSGNTRSKKCAAATQNAAPSGDLVLPCSSRSISTRASAKPSKVKGPNRGSTSVSTRGRRDGRRLKRSFSEGNSSASTSCKDQTASCRKRSKSNVVFNSSQQTPVFMGTRSKCSGIKDIYRDTTTRGSKVSDSQRFRCLQCHKPQLPGNLSWCMIGHPCCGGCLQDQIKLQLIRSQKDSLRCVTTGCSSYYLSSQLQRTLPNMVLKDVEDKLKAGCLDHTSTQLTQSAGGQTHKQKSPVQISERNVESNAEKMSDHSVTLDSGSTRSKRRVIMEGRLDYPDMWEDMEQDLKDGYKLVEVIPGTEEYSSLWVKFYWTMAFPWAKIISVQRIQNPNLWMFYCMKKRQMVKDNGGQEVLEKQLFHGTKHALVEAIAKNNFDWRMCGVNGTSFGQGSYFATNASYSHRFTDGAVHGKPIKKPKSGRKIYKAVRKLNKLTAAQRKSLKFNAVSSTLNILQNGQSSASATSTSNQVMTSPVTAPVPVSTSSLSNLQSVQSSAAATSTSTQALTSQVTPPISISVSNLNNLHPVQSSAAITSASNQVVTSPVSAAVPTSVPGLNNLQPVQSSASATSTSNQTVTSSVTAPVAMVSNISTVPTSSLTATSYLTHSIAPSTSGTSQNQAVSATTTHNPSSSGGNGQTNPNSNSGAFINGSDNIGKETYHTILVGKVLIGRYAQGSSNLRKPPPINNTDLYGKAYDSCVDDVYNPNIFVIFDSAQCYPEFVLNYKINSQV